MDKDTRRMRREPGTSLPLRLAMAAGLIPGGAALASPPGQDVPPATPSTESSPVSVLSRTSALWSNPHWTVIKEIWRTLDVVEPGANGYTGQLLESIEAQELGERFYTAMNGLIADADELGLDSVELNVLRRLVQDRLDLLTWGTMMPMTRMMPPPVIGQIGDVVERIETRIDQILDLRTSELIGSDEMAEAFGLLTAEVDLYAARLAVETHVGWSGPLGGAVWPEDIDSMSAMIDSLREQTLARIEANGESYENELTEVTEVFESVSEGLEATMARIPTLNELLMDLELF